MDRDSGFLSNDYAEEHVPGSELTAGVFHPRPIMASVSGSRIVD